jgi:hypothetical protein
VKKRIAVFQSNYIPWKGYFDLIGSVDEFILDDNVQYTKQSWRNRNRIKTHDGLQWLTIPVHVQFPQQICETEIAHDGWRQRHWRSIESAYHRSARFGEFGVCLEALYQTATFARLSQVNEHFLRGICDWMGIRTPFLRTTDMPVAGERNERIVEICRLRRATGLLNGPSAREHMDERCFVEAGITVEYADYDSYPDYPQLHGPFEHAVSIIDLLLNCGRDFGAYTKRFPSQSAG